MSSRGIQAVALLVVGFMLIGSARAISAAENSSAKRPNIIVIVGDDLGYGELGCYGGKEIATPHLDALARGGVRATSGYVSCPVCSPTRAGLLTGRYQQRFGYEFNPGESKEFATAGLPLSQTTLPARLKAAGYHTGMVGKWHLGFAPEQHPLSRGFDEYFGFLGGAHSYIDGTQLAALNSIRRGRSPVVESEYLTDAFTREAVAFIDQHRAEPFFLYLAYNAVHTPMQAPERYLNRVSAITEPKRRKMAAMLTALDDGVGSVMSHLAKHGLAENTLVFFIADNGGPTKFNTSRNDPLSGVKTEVREGGIRVPFIIHWQGRVPAGKTMDDPIISLDIVPTVMAAANKPIEASEKLDGVDLLPYLLGQQSQPPHAALYWRFGKQSAIRQGDWKLIKNTDGTMLFNLAEDIGEQNDLASKESAKLKELADKLAAWNAELAPPLWPSRRF